MLTTFFNFWEYWELRHKVTFDGEARIILINYGVEEIDVKRDIYSSWKEWVQLTSHLYNASYPIALRSVGGDPTVAGQSLGATFFLENGWRIRSWQGDHRLVVTGNLFTAEGESTFLNTEGDYSILIQSQVSNLVDVIVAQPEAPDQVNLTSTAVSDVASAVRTTLDPEISRLDVDVSSRASQASVDTIDSKVDLLDTMLELVDTKIDNIATWSGTVDVNLTQLFQLMDYTRKYMSNRSKIDPVTKTLEIFDDNGTTVVARFKLKNATGTESVTSIYEREPQNV